MRVLKFGGSCLRDGAGLPRAVELVCAAEGPTCAVLSALEGVTDRLRELTHPAQVDALRATHAPLLDPLSGEPRGAGEAALDAACAELHALLASPATPARRDQILGWGERTLAAIAAAYFAQRGHPVVQRAGSAAGLVTDATFGHARFAPEARHLARAALAGLDAVLVPGFVGQTVEGAWTTLGRGGSDTTAVFLGLALDAPVTLYKDTALLSADPALVPEARVLPAVDPAAALALARAGLPAIAADALTLGPAPRLEVRAFTGSARSLVAPHAPPLPAVAWLPLASGEVGVSLVGVDLEAAARALACLEDAQVRARPAASDAHLTWVVPAVDCRAAVAALHRAFVERDRAASA